MHVGTVELWGLLACETLNLVTVVLAGVRCVLVTDRPPLKDTLTEMLRFLFFVSEGVKKLIEPVIASEFKQLHLLERVGLPRVNNRHHI